MPLLPLAICSATSFATIGWFVWIFLLFPCEQSTTIFSRHCAPRNCNEILARQSEVHNRCNSGVTNLILLQQLRRRSDRVLVVVGAARPPPENKMPIGISARFDNRNLTLRNSPRGFSISRNSFLPTHHRHQKRGGKRALRFISLPHCTSMVFGRPCVPASGERHPGSNRAWKQARENHPMLAHEANLGSHGNATLPRNHPLKSIVSVQNDTPIDFERALSSKLGSWVTTLCSATLPSSLY